MNKVKNLWKVYLALFVLIVISVVLPLKEGLNNPDGNNWLDFSSWFTTSSSNIERDRSSTSVVYDNRVGTGSSGRKYTNTSDENDELTSNEKTYARSALTKLIGLNEGNEVLIDCINKVKVKL